MVSFSLFLQYLECLRVEVYKEGGAGSVLQQENAADWLPADVDVLNNATQLATRFVFEVYAR
jgi:hypothetical protein